MIRRGSQDLLLAIVTFIVSSVMVTATTYTQAQPSTVASNQQDDHDHPVTSTMDYSTILVKLIGELGTVGALIWYAWFTTSKTLPTKDADHRAERKELLESFRQERKELAEDANDRIEKISEAVDKQSATVQRMIEWCSAKHSNDVPRPIT